MAGYDDLREHLDAGRADPDVDVGASPFDLGYGAGQQHSSTLDQILGKGAPEQLAAMNVPTQVPPIDENPTRAAPSGRPLPPISEDTRNDIDALVNPNRHRSSAWLGPAIAESHANMAPETRAYMEKRLGLGDGGGPGAPVGGPRSTLKHDQRIGAAPPDPAAPVVAPRDEFKAPVEDPAVVAARAQQANHQANQMRTAQALAGMKANESHVGNLMDRAAQIMTFGDNRMGTMSPNGEETARLPVQDLAAAQAKSRQEDLDASARHEALFKNKLQEYVTNTGKRAEDRKSLQDATRDSETSRHNKAEENLKRAEITAMADKAAKAGAVAPNLPPTELENVHKGAQATDAAKDLAKKQADVGFSGFVRAIHGPALGAQRVYEQAQAEHAPVLMSPDQRQSPQGFQQFKESSPAGTQDETEAQAYYQHLAHDRTDEAARRAEGLAKERYNPQGVQQMMGEVQQAKAKQKAFEGGAPDSGVERRVLPDGRVLERGPDGKVRVGN